MKLYRYEYEGCTYVGIGVPERDGLCPILLWNEFPCEDVSEIILNNISAEVAKCYEYSQRPTAVLHPMDEVKLLSPIPHPRQDVLCLGINYLAHAAESAGFDKEAFGGERPYPIFFSKRAYETTGDGDAIPAYEDLVEGLDYEVELGVIIGRDAKNVAPEDAYDYIFGYTIVNDVSARNLQTRHKQWYYGKSLDGFTPIGPCVVTVDEFDTPPALGIRSYVNGELRQNSTTDLLITSIADIISELSQGMTLKAGTIIATGTPAGVGMGFNPPRFLKHGDVVRCEIDGIGSLTNIVD